MTQPPKNWTPEEISKIARAIPLEYWKYDAPDGGYDTDEYLSVEFKRVPKVSLSIRAFKEADVESKRLVDGPSPILEADLYATLGREKYFTYYRDDFTSLFTEIRQKVLDYKKRLENTDVIGVLTAGGLEEEILKKLNGVGERR